MLHIKKELETFMYKHNIFLESLNENVCDRKIPNLTDIVYNRPQRTFLEFKSVT